MLEAFDTPAWISHLGRSPRAFEQVNEPLARAVLRTRRCMVDRAVCTAFPFVPPVPQQDRSGLRRLPSSQGILGVGHTARWVRVHETPLKDQGDYALGLAHLIPVDCERLGICGESEASVALLGALVDISARTGAVCLYGEPGVGHAEFAMLLVRLQTGSTERVVQLKGQTLHPDQLGRLSPDARFVIVSQLQEAEVQGQTALMARLRHMPMTRLIVTSTEDPRLPTRQGRLDIRVMERLAGHTIRIPPLRERIEDVPYMARCLVRVRSTNDRPIVGISHRSESRLTSHRWPGNLPELHRVVEAGLRRSPGPIVELRPTRQLDGEMRQTMSLENAVRAHIVSALDATGWRIEGETGAAALLGLAPSTLRSKMARYRIRRMP